VYIDNVGPDYSESMGTPVVAGRGLSMRDDENAPPVAVINQSMARRFFGNKSALGRHVGSTTSAQGIR
jgi:hypothetical protein